MYLREGLVLNSGAVADLTLHAAFNADGSPKPIVIVGSNGSGKTSLLALIADALIEVAALKLQGVTPSQGMQRQFYRVLGGRSVRLSASYEIAAMRFEHQSSQFVYRSKVGKVKPEELAARMSAFAPLATWPGDEDNNKAASGPLDKVAEIYNNGAYIFFPAERFELPYWINLELLARDPNASFTPQYADRLSKPVVVQTSFQELKSWILGLLVDSNLNSMEAISLPTLELVRAVAMEKLASTSPALSGTAAVLSTILRRQVMITRLARGHGERRICIAAGNEQLLPTLENLSAGQASLLSMFGSILSYGDGGQVPLWPAQIEGIVLIDEADAHLHADLQHDVLPALIKMFPRVQFIVTSHTPLFPLGMTKLFGEDGFSLVEMPGGTTIDMERFSEFEASFAYFQATRAFEQSVKERLTQNHDPLVLCEGETDPKYLTTAAELRGLSDLATKVRFEWIGRKAITGEAQGGGQSNLESARRFLLNNPQFLIRKVVLLYDCDTQKQAMDHDDLFIRCIAKNEKNSITDRGIENLLPDEVFEQSFYSEKTIPKGPDRTITKQLRKTELCNHLCNVVRDPAHFVGFNDVLQELQTLLLAQS